MNSNEDCHNTRNKITERLKPADIVLLVGSLVLTLAVVTIYMAQENTLYWCDFNYYHIMAVAASQKLLEDPGGFPLLVIASTCFNYNLLYAVPILPAILLFGSGRECFIASIAVLYQLPFLLFLAGSASLTFKPPDDPQDPMNRRMVFWLALFLSLSTATIWAPTLRGYPDYGAAGLVMLACFLYLKDSKLESKKSILFIGLLLGAAPLIRRHFFYLSFAQAAAMLIHQLYLRHLNRTDWSTFSKKFVVRWILTGLVSAVFLSTVGFLFINTIISNPYFSLYKSAYVSIPEGINYLIHSYGVVTFASACAGIILGLKHKILDREATSFFLSFAVLSFLVWPIFGKHIAIHYTIYSDTFVILGNLAMFLWLAGLKPIRFRSYACALAVFFWSFNFVLGLSNHKESYMVQTKYGMLTVPLSKPDFMGRLVSANYSPLERKDYPQLEKLYEYLVKLSRGKQQVFIASDNSVLGADIFRNLERRLTGKFKAESIRFIEPPILDSRDALALEALLMCDYVVIPTPFLPMYEAEDSKDLEVVLKAFANGWAIAEDFRERQETFKLDRDTTVKIFERVRPTTATTAAITFDRMKNFIGVELSGQPAWITTDGKYIAHDQQNKSEYKTKLNTEGSKNHYLLSSGVFTGGLRLSGAIKPPRKTDVIKATLEAVDVSGNAERTIKTTAPVEKDGSFILNLKTETSNPCHLNLYFNRETQVKTGVDDELIEVKDLQVLKTAL